MEATTISTVLIKQRSKQQSHQLPRGTAKWCSYQVQSRFVVGPAKHYKSNKKLALQVIFSKRAVTLVDLTMIFNTFDFR